MVDSLAMLFGAKKRRVKSHGTIVVNCRTRKLYKGPNGGVFYKTKSGSTYVDSKFISKHSPKRRSSPKRRRRASPKRRRRASPKRRRRASPKRRRRASPKRRRRASPKRRRRASPKRRRVGYGIGLGQPSLLNMMGPAGLTVIPSM